MQHPSWRVESRILLAQKMPFCVIDGSVVHVDADAPSPSHPTIRSPSWDHATSSVPIYVPNDVRMLFLALVPRPSRSDALACVSSWNCRSISHRGGVGFHPYPCLLASKVVGWT